MNTKRSKTVGLSIHGHSSFPKRALIVDDDTDTTLTFKASLDGQVLKYIHIIIL